VSPVFVIYLVLILGGFYMLVVRPRRVQAQKAASLRSSLQPGDSVVTIGGIYGIVDSTEGDDVLLEISEGVVVRVASRAIATTLHHEDEDEDEEDSDAHDDDAEELHDDVEPEAHEDAEKPAEEPADEPAERRAEG
jgi:preprotein translocase subunit YajC